MSSRRPRIASPTSCSTLPSPYISAVSTWLMPRSRPRRSAATARERSSRSMFQVPWPTTETSRPVGPKGALRIVPSSAAAQLEQAPPPLGALVLRRYREPRPRRRVTFAAHAHGHRIAVGGPLQRGERVLVSRVVADVD